jgi:methylated-DNA-[protein]-cysteine S-methyltransferase
MEPAPATDFQRRVWAACAQVPYGATATYAELARIVGSPQGARAVGQALGANPLPVLVPCHRILASDGTLGGYGGGLPMKRGLLALEGVTLRA